MTIRFKARAQKESHSHRFTIKTGSHFTGRFSQNVVQTQILMAARQVISLGVFFFVLE